MPSDEHRFYRHVMQMLQERSIPFLAGGAFALATYTGIHRDTKDLDLFVRPGDAQRILRLFADAGYKTERNYPWWLGKIWDVSDAFVDIIWDSPSGSAPVDDDWFAHARDGIVFGMPVKTCPAEEMIWHKAFVLDRQRCDVADVAHLFLRADAMDWDRLLRRFGPHWRLLYAQIALFMYIYPGERGRIPKAVLDDMARRLADDDAGEDAARLCYGTMLSGSQYLFDLGRWGYKDARLPPHGSLSPEQIAFWSAGIGG